jgi:hypothetical protein
MPKSTVISPVQSYQVIVDRTSQVDLAIEVFIAF